MLQHVSSAACRPGNVPFRRVVGAGCGVRVGKERTPCRGWPDSRERDRRQWPRGRGGPRLRGGASAQAAPRCPLRESERVMALGACHSDRGRGSVLRSARTAGVPARTPGVLGREWQRRAGWETAPAGSDAARIGTGFGVVRIMATRGTDNGNGGTDNGNKGTDNDNKGTDNGNKGTENGNRVPVSVLCA